jgi:hemerythrin
MEKTMISTGIYWVEIPEADLYILCGCPADSVKHLMKRGLIVQKESNGIKYENGPNAILLSDVTLQNGRFSNLAEFPVLQMFYRQGMILPNHPNNTGIKPMLIGIENQVKAQAEYIYRGNYGLVSADEITAAGVSADVAREMMRLKLRFAFDNIRKTEDLIDMRIADRDAVELRNGVFVHRAGVNRYEFLYGGRKVEVDLNLSPKESYEASYQLGFHKIKREYFSVIHTGEGDGWDPARPCMASIITYQGRIFIIDAGPSIAHSLTSLGISVNEIEGIFHTHAHDDHFNGLTVLLRTDHRIKYYATPLVRSSVIKKLSALTGMDENQFARYFDVHDLDFDRWNDIDGLEVMPLFSPHPLETSTLMFRTLWEDGYKTYYHMADTVALPVLEGMIADDRAKSGVSRAFHDRVKKEYLIPVDLKKIDIGGGLIHGRAEDFIEDKSEKIILSHTERPLNDSQKEIGASATFGMEDTLVPANQEYTLRAAEDYLCKYFLSSKNCDVRRLLNCPVVTHNPGSILIRKGAVNKHIFLIVSGVAEYIDTGQGIHNTLSAGSMAGELSGMLGTASPGTCRSESYVTTLRIPSSLYVEFVKRNNLYDEIKRLHDMRWFLQNTGLFGEMISWPVMNEMARRIKKETVPKGAGLKTGSGPALFLLLEGELAVCSGVRKVEIVGPGGFFGEESIVRDTAARFSASATKKSVAYRIPGDALADIPIVQWKLLETLDRREKILDLFREFEWKKDYSVGVAELDEKHKDLFETINSLFSVYESCRNSPAAGKKMDLLISKVKEHFEREEALMKQCGYTDFSSHHKEHRRLLKDITDFKKDIGLGGSRDESDCLEFLKNWLVGHTLTIDMKYGPAMNAKSIF